MTVSTKEELCCLLNKEKDSFKREYYLFEYFLFNNVFLDEVQYILSNVKGLKDIDVLKSAYNDEGMLKGYSYNFLKKYYGYANSMFDKYYSESCFNYKNIIKKFNSLANNDFNYNNSLELAILFTIMLNNGCFSINGEHKYNIENRLNIIGHYSFDLFYGRGVCLNYSEMLNDILKDTSYESMIMLCKFKNNESEHATTLIFDNDSPYLFDAANFTIFECNDYKTAGDISSTRNLNLDSFLSYCYDAGRGNSFDVLNKFCLGKDYNSFSSKNNFLSTYNKCFDWCKNNISLVQDFCDEIHPNILKIVEETKNKEKSKVFK